MQLDTIAEEGNAKKVRKFFPKAWAKMKANCKRKPKANTHDTFPQDHSCIPNLKYDMPMYVLSFQIKTFVLVSKA